MSTSPGCAEVVAGNEPHVEVAQAGVGDRLPLLAGDEQRVAALSAVGGRDERAAVGAPGGDHALDGFGREVGPVGENDDGGLDAAPSSSRPARRAMRPGRASSPRR